MTLAPKRLATNHIRLETCNENIVLDSHPTFHTICIVVSCDNFDLNTNIVNYFKSDRKLYNHYQSHQFVCFFSSNSYSTFKENRKIRLIYINLVLIFLISTFRIYINPLLFEKESLITQIIYIRFFFFYIGTEPNWYFYSVLLRP